MKGTTLEHVVTIYQRGSIFKYLDMKSRVDTL